MSRIGIFGGSFHPPHRAHRLLVETAIETLGLDRVVVLPAPSPPHKPTGMTVSFEHRLAMTRLLFADLPKVLVSDMEASRSGPSYTVDTLEAFAAASPGASLYLLVGGDAYEAFPTWHRWRRILDLATVVILERPGYKGRGSCLLENAAAGGQGLLLLDRFHSPLSASAVRGDLALYGHSDGLTPQVAAYIAAHGLYPQIPMTTYRELIRARLPEKRFQHSLRVAETAVALADAHGLDRQRAEVAGLLHDYAKYEAPEDLLRKAEAAGLLKDPSERQARYLLHGPVGAWELREAGIIEDPDILKGIAAHTVGHPDMMDLEKIIFLADYVEPGRKTPHIREIFEAAKKDLDRGLLMALDQTITYLIGEGQPVHPDAVRCRNQLLLKERARG